LTTSHTYKPSVPQADSAAVISTTWLQREGFGLSFITRLRRLSAARTASQDGIPTDTPEEETTEGSAEETTGDSAADGAEETTENSAADDAGSAGGHGARRLVAWTITTLAGLLVLFALLAPSQYEHFTPEAFLRIPAEAPLGVLLVLVLPARARPVVAALGGVVLGLMIIVKAFDVGFNAVLYRPFDLVLDWPLLGPAVDFLDTAIGQGGAIAIVAAVVVLAAGIVVLTTLSALHITRLVNRHRPRAWRAVSVLSAVWIACTVPTVDFVPNVPVASDNAAAYLFGHALQVRAGIQDQEKFEAEAAVDAFRGTPGDQFLTALRGKDVALTFVESYGRDAVENPEYAPQIGPLLDDGTRRLREAGFASRSAFLTSPITGGGSWLAHATLLSGLRIDNEQRYRNLVTSDRLTLSGAFRRANWDAVGIMPGVTRAWPDGAFFEYERVRAAQDLGYRGPQFGWAMMPDQYVMSAFQRLERAKPDHPPVMATIPLVTSHGPWSPIPTLLNWNEIGDGSVYNTMPAGAVHPDAVLGRDPAQVRADYRRSIEYSLNSLISYVQAHGDDRLVLVFVGDHQPSPLVTGDRATRDVPITIVARDPAVLDRISGWGWQDGLKPSPQAPVWPMSDFRDRFLTAYGPQLPPTQPPAQQAQPPAQQAQPPAQQAQPPAQPAQ
jgi:hypothetical protein